MGNHSQKIEKYLLNYAWPPVKQINTSGLRTPCFHNAVAIPAYSESLESLQQACSALEKNRHCCLVWIDNYPEGSVEPTIHNEHLAYLQSSYCAVNEFCPDIHAFETQNNNLVLFANLAIAEKQGVGQARKIANDLLLTLYKENILTSEWVLNTDADIVFKQILFSLETSNSNENTSVKILPFAHVESTDNNTNDATRLYESLIRYYCSGLEYAGSPYAFLSLGSTILINLDFYASARGFPRRQAGEDFYLLNKLAKLGNIEQLASPVIEINSRLSNRVPFGTGPAVTRITQTDKPWGENITTYNPAVFVKLRELLRHIHNLNQTFTNCHETNRALQELGFQSFLEHCNKQSITGDKFKQHFHTWFDALRTLRFIHLLRDSGLSDMTLNNVSEIVGRPVFPGVNE